MKKHIYIVIAIIFCMAQYACEEDKYKVEIPMSGITLSVPEDKSVIDLNNESINEYNFSWNESSEGGNTLILSDSEHLLNPITIKVGTDKSYSITSDMLDQYFSEFGIGSGQTDILYWSVKPTEKLSVAASQIRSFAATRMSTKLLEPEDQFTQSLNGDNPESPLYFSWNTEGIDDNTEFAICIGDKADLTGKKVTIPVGAVNAANITHQQLQLALDQMGVKKYITERVYWNILNLKNNKLISRSSAALFLKGMMVLVDTRGDESIRYKVTRISYSDGTSLIWLAENLRTKKYPDGRDIEAEKIKFAPVSLGEDYVKAYGGYYHLDVKTQIAPAGWRLPTVDDYEKLFYETSVVPGRWNVLKDGVYYEKFDKDAGHINEWGLGLVSAGQWSGEIVNHKEIYCYMLVLDCEPGKCLLHDNGGTLWWPWTTGATARFIFEE